MTTPGSRPVAYLGVLLLGGGVATLAAALARVLAFAMGHHLAYLVLGMALLGFAAGSSLVTLGALRRPRRERPDAAIAAHALAAAITAPLAYLMSTRVVFEPVRVFDEPVNLVSLLLIAVIAATPFVFAGAATGSAVTFYRARGGAAYGLALLGAGLGALAVPFALEPLTGPGLLVAAACTLAIASACFGFSDCRARGSIPAAVRATVVLALAGAIAWQTLPAARAGRLDPRLVPGKDLSPFASAVEFTRWSPLARIDVTKENPPLPVPGVAFGESALVPKWRGVFRDGVAATLLLAQPGSGPTDALRRSTTGAAFVALAARGCSAPETLALDVGGGVDLQIALAHGARHVTGVEADPVILDLLRTSYADYTGRVAEHPDVQLVHADGRRFVRVSTRDFDLIQLNGTDRPTALDAGAQTPAEGHRYTVEAFGELLDRLRGQRASQGLVCASRYLHPAEPQQSLRLAATAIAALEAHGVPAAHRNVFALHGGPAPTPWASFLFGPQPFAVDELARLRTFCAENGFTILFDPEQAGNSPFDACLRSDANTRARFFAEYASDVTPTHDDRPFFHDVLRWSTLFGSGPTGAQALLSRVPADSLILLLAMLQAIVLGAFCLNRPLRDLDRGARDGTTRGALLCFGALGVAFAALVLALAPHVFRLLDPPIAGTLALPLMLASAGLGAFTVTPRTRPLRRLGLVAMTAPLLIVAAWWGVTHELDAWLARSLAFRIGIAVAIVAPPACLLGMACAAALRLLDARRPELVPWAFAAHAFAIVFGAAGASLLARNAGYAALWFTTAGVCALGLVAILWTLRFAGDAARSDVVSLEPTGHEGDPE